MEFLVILGLPWHFYADPALAATPIRIPEETSSVNMKVLSDDIFISHPEDRVVPKTVTKLFLDFVGPFFGTVTPSPVPDSLLKFAPRVAKLDEALAIL
jgi:hypothetical protein